MGASEEIVRQHIAALAQFDWAALEASASPNRRLVLTGVADWDWTLASLYRSVTQAWDFTLEEVQLVDEGSGTVRARLRLTNGGAAKEVEGEYHVVDGRIDAVILTDSRPFAD